MAVQFDKNDPNYDKDSGSTKGCLIRAEQVIKDKKRPLPHGAGNGQVLGRAEMETQENRPHRR